ncbi:hypothetical protein Tco_0655998 [Tanacetum coccineum]|uniref:Uncharacterized protein n=1 Tax=Tanacetum coccineum TaxID=301880 RepID=A0ABQ4X7L0_9ASTR
MAAHFYEGLTERALRNLYLPDAGVKQMSPETLKELQDESVSGRERNLMECLRKEMLYPPGYCLNAHAWSSGCAQ